jgi:hypothetical protein
MTNVSKISENEPILVKINGSKNQYYNVAPFLGKDQFLGMQENHFEFLKNIIKKCQRVVACANISEIPLDDDEVKLLLFNLFELETMFEKCTIVNA